LQSLFESSVAKTLLSRDFTSESAKALSFFACFEVQLLKGGGPVSQTITGYAGQGHRND